MTMRRSFCLTACAAAVLISSCNTPNPMPSGTLRVAALKVSGPAIVAPGATAQFTATAAMSDGSSQDYTTKVTWTSSSTAVVTITTAGLATGHGTGDAQLRATLPTVYALASVTVVPAGTFRLTGLITESGLPVADAQVTVIAGLGAGLAIQSDYSGTYRLYGVAGNIQVQVTKAGYSTDTKSTTIASNDVLDFPDFTQAGAVPSLGGTYTLTLQTSDDCSVPRQSYNFSVLPAFPVDERLRTYTAVVTQTGPGLVVTLSGANFLIQSGKGNSFKGRLEPGALTFTIGDGYFYYLADLDVIEQLPSGKLLAFDGLTTITPVTGVLHAPFEGTVFELASAQVPNVTNQCSSANHQFTMTPLNGPARKRR